MVEEKVVKECEARSLIAQLGRDGVIVSASGWLLPEDSDRHILFVSSPVVDEKGSIASYLAVQEALNSIRAKALSISDITIVSPRDPVVKQIKPWADLVLTNPPYSFSPFSATTVSEEPKMTFSSTTGVTSGE